MATHPPDPQQERTDSRTAPLRGRTVLESGRARRILSGVVGGFLLVRGLRRRGLRGIVTAIVGGWLLSRAVGAGGRLGDTVRTGTDVAGTSSDQGPPAERTEIHRSVTVGRSPDELYEIWRDPDQLSTIAGGVADVTAPEADRLAWTVHGPGGRDFSWETRIVEDEPGERLRWETPPDATVPMEGSITFDEAAGDRGTIVTMSTVVEPPGGDLGRAVLAGLDVVPGALSGAALDRFKSLAETGEVPTLEGNSSARGSGDLL